LKHSVTFLTTHLTNKGLQQISDRNFRFQGKQVFLTYSRCNSPLESIVESLTRRSTPERPIRIAVGVVESHADNYPHVHLYLQYGAKLDTRSSRYFDFLDDGGTVFHPNIRRSKGNAKSVLRIYEYLNKQGDCKILAGKFDPFPGSTGFQRKKADLDSWIVYKRAKAIPKITWPRHLPSGSEILEPSDAMRRRHIWLWGPSGSGKTKWFEEEFGQYSYYAVQNSPYPFDDYEQQRVILYDDFIPDKIDLIKLANPRKQRQPAPKQQRYATRFLPPEAPLLIIVLSNFSISTAITPMEQPAFESRFIEETLLQQD